MGKLLITICISLYSLSAWSHLLVIEMESESEHTEAHADDVTFIACRGLEDFCHLAFTKQLLLNEYPYISSLLPEAQVVNLSLGFQAPRAKQDFHESFDSDRPSYHEQMIQYKERKEFSQNMMSQNQDTLFVAAAGNGFNLGLFYTDGVPLSDKFTIYPAIYSKDNLVTVAAIQAQSIEPNQLEDYTLTEYSNYSIHSVDVAAPVELNNQQSELRGTSFSAPYISRLSYQILQIHPSLTPNEIKKILMMSSYVIGIERAIEITEDWINNGENSMFAQLEKISHFRKRQEMLDKIGEVMLVRSGGPIIDTVARQCASNLKRLDISTEEACLMAQDQWLGLTEQREQQLRHFWALRGISQ